MVAVHAVVPELNAFVRQDWNQILQIEIHRGAAHLERIRKVMDGDILQIDEKHQVHIDKPLGPAQVVGLLGIFFLKYFFNCILCTFLDYYVFFDPRLICGACSSLSIAFIFSSL